MKQPIVWIHDDGLRPNHPSLVRWPGRPALFTIDDEKWKADGWTFKRLLFVYQCALEVGCDIARGHPVDMIDDFLMKHGGDGISTMGSPCPRHQIILRQLQEKWPVEVLPPDAFLRAETDFDLRRFSRYWAKAKNLLPRKPQQDHPG